MGKKKIAVLTSGWSIDFISRIIKGLRSATEGKNIDLYFFVPYKFTEISGEPNVTGFAIFDLIDYSKFDGVIIIPNLFNDQQMVQREYKRILEAGIPAVSLIDKLEGLHYIYSETETAFYKLVSHLIEVHNVKNFSFIGGPDGNAGGDSHLKAFKKALQDHNLSIDDDNLYLHGDWSYNFGYEQAKKIFTKPERPEAIVCVNDWAALAVMQVALEHGLSVPENVIVTGFDEVTFSRMVIPSITSSNLLSEEIGRRAIEILLENPSELVTTGVAAEPVFRQSCGCVKNINLTQKMYTQGFFFETEKPERFMSQLRHMENLFIKYDSFAELQENSQKFFLDRHTFEGPDFAILLGSEVVQSFKEASVDYKAHSTYEKNMKIVVNIQDGKTAPLGEIATADLIPENMVSDKSTSYLLCPIFNQKYLHGYYVSKDYFGLINNKSAYNWTRAVGTSLEKFRQKVNYRLMSEQLRELSIKDALSGLMNRTGLDSNGVELFNNNNKTGLNTQIIFIDINNMKLINDQYGHLHGDLAVKTVAESIELSIPSDYVAARFGGDEFVIVGGCSEMISAKIPDRIIETLKDQVVKLALPYDLTVSLGAKTFQPGEKHDLMDAIKDVDQIMYKNKKKFHKTDRE